MTTQFNNNDMNNDIISKNYLEFFFHKIKSYVKIIYNSGVYNFVSK